jgi:hypothetical protein
MVEQVGSMSPLEFFSEQRLLAAGATPVLAASILRWIKREWLYDGGKLPDDYATMDKLLSYGYDDITQMYQTHGMGKKGLTVIFHMIRSAGLPIKDRKSLIQEFERSK